MQLTFKEQYQKYLAAIEAYLDDCCFCYEQEPQKDLFDSMRYSLLAGGKRLRPILVFDFCRMCGGDWRKAIPFAAAVEMIHTYSLIHDDLPSMDNDDYRRGRLTNHKVFGEAMAILAGDALLTDAFAVCTMTELANPANMGFAVAMLAECAGSLGMVGGQVLDIMAESRELNEQEVIDIQSRKTGRLINAACVLGVIAAGGTGVQIEEAAKFAGRLGLAFQIRDDMLDVIGTQEQMGKGVGTDENKNTFVKLYGLEKCEELVQKYTAGAIESLKAFQNTEFMHELALSLTSRTV